MKALHRTTPTAALAWFVFGALAAGCAVDGGVEPGATPGTTHGSRDAGAADASTMTLSSVRRTMEICGNGIDDDGNGRIDDGCACLPMDTQNCYLGDPSQAGVGACRWGTQTCSGGSEFGTWGACVGAGSASTETCDDVDNNCDGVTDEGCGCLVGAHRLCYDGVASTEAVGTCHGGTQDCTMLPDGTSAWGTCAGEVTPTAETCNHLDDDCDGTADNAPSGSPGSCDACGPGLTETYVPTAGGGGSGVIMGGSALYRTICAPGSPCPMGEVAVSQDGPLGGGRGAAVCTTPPPTCPAGQVLDFQSGAWVCESCEIIVEFGAEFGNQHACTTTPHLMCDAGQVPTFVYETRTWQCRPTCDNGEYDQHYLSGQLVCVPC